MEPENTSPVETHTKRNYSLVALLAVLVIVGVVIILLPQGKVPEQGGVVKTVPVEKNYTQAEKEQILASLAASLPADATSQAEKERILRNLAKKVPADTTSNEEKIRILNALSASAEL